MAPTLQKLNVWVGSLSLAFLNLPLRVNHITLRVMRLTPWIKPKILNLRLIQNLSP
uniref:Uncharacterized protein n=1 Tax=Suberites domuncula TaxID=55567 RepID=B1GT45_SUBDO|nr:hypothetical protein [Suberites domuncula]